MPDYCPFVDGRCPFWIALCHGLIICEEDCPYWSNEF